MRVRSILLNLRCLTLLMASPAWAQQGTIIGTAADETKAALPGVNVTATDRILAAHECGHQRSRRIPDRERPPGKYHVAELAGFTRCR
jgi:hypothetical protein